MKKFDMILLEKELAEGITGDDLEKMLTYMKYDGKEPIFPLNITGFDVESALLGFISERAFNECFDMDEDRIIKLFKYIVECDKCFTNNPIIMEVGDFAFYISVDIPND